MRYGEAGEVDNVYVEGVPWVVVYNELMQPMQAYLGNMDALAAGEYPVGTGVLNFELNKATGFLGTNYNPDDRLRPPVSALPTRQVFYEQLKSMSNYDSLTATQRSAIERRLAH